MIILFGDKKEKCKKEICEILFSYGSAYYSDCTINNENNNFTVISCNKISNINIKKGMVIFCTEDCKFKEQLFPTGVIGVCEDSNTSALNSFKNSCLSVITCGMNNKNSLTISSLENQNIQLSLQRTFTDTNGKTVEPQEISIKLNKTYLPYSVMAATVALLYEGIKPKES